MEILELKSSIAKMKKICYSGSIIDLKWQKKESLNLKINKKGKKKHSNNG